MRLGEFDYPLPTRLIAKRPARRRDRSRLLRLDGNTGAVSESIFKNLPDFLRPGDLLVLNDTAVMPARLFATKATGGRVEILLEEKIDANKMCVQIRASKAPKPDSLLYVHDAVRLRVIKRQNDMFILAILEPELTVDDLLNRYGHVPLPPYIDRPDDDIDRVCYQTIYARHSGAVAAPTAGLHFTDELFAELTAGQIDRVFLTLHIGAGTFQPVRVADIRRHKMHTEYLRVPEQAVAKINDTKRNGGRIVAVGTTAVRGLETASSSGQLRPFEGKTNIFIYPGFRFRTVDLLITNFHLPGSTLLMLVCAFAGRRRVLDAYQYAVDNNFHFYSYGDAMLITKNESAQ